MQWPPVLLAGDSPRSEHDPDLEATAAVTIAMHPVTGAFADPLHELAFAAHLFRLAFPCHAFLMALLLGLTIWTTLGAPAELSSVLVWRVIVPILALGLVGRVLVHRMNDSVRAQRIGSWTWMALLVLANTADMCGFLNAPAVGCAQISKAAALLPLFYLATALINGSHGLGFVLKAALTGPVLVKCFSAIAVCGQAGVVLMSIAIMPMTIAGFVLAHMAEMHLRHSYAEKQRLAEDVAEDKRSLQEKVDDEMRRLEERLEQLRAEKERLMYDVQRRGQPLGDGDDRSAIRRGLQAGPSSQPYHRADSTDSSETGAPAPSDSLPASLPPGPPSTKSSNSSEPISIAGNSTAPPSPTLAHPSALARGPVSELVAGQVADALLTQVLADKEALFELQILLHSATEESAGGRPAQEPNQGSQGPLPAQTNSSVVPSVTVAQQQRAIPHRMQDTVTVDSTLQVQRDVREMLASYSPVVPSCNVHEPAGSLGGQSSMSTGQQALHVARHRMHAASVEVEVYHAIRTLAIALGASRTEGGTIKALQAVLLQLERPEMSCDEARTATGASMSNFKKWKRRVHQARLN